MADFRTPFARDGEKRYPEPTEAEQGHPCGPAERQLFNALQYRLEAEVGHVIEHAGIVGTDSRMTQLREAIEALIAVAIGMLPEEETPDLSGFILLAQAAARLPIYPEVAGGIIPCLTPSTGVVRIPGGYTIMHRGINPVVTTLTDIATAANKIYHLRWVYGVGFGLYDLANGTYNPGALAENSTAFDTSYDSMLIARVVTNSSNALTVTNLMNVNQLYTMVTGNPGVTLPAQNAANASVYLAYNWSRQPRAYIPIITGMNISPDPVVSKGFGPSNGHDHDTNLSVTALDRYGCTVACMRDYAIALTLSAVLIG